jgi:tetratricopeptide (TPR) repeat protein
MACFNKETMYGPCHCGSGTKFKFCCYEKERHAAKARDDSFLSSATMTAPDGSPVIVLETESGERLNDQGLRLMASGKFKEAAESFRRSIAAAPVIPSPHNNLALCLFMNGSAEEAIRIQRRAIKEIPGENIFGQGNIVHFLWATGQTADAEKEADKLAPIRPNSVHAMGKKCESFARLERHQAILDTLDADSGMADDYCHFFAGMAAANLGMFDRALDHLRNVRARQPISARAHEMTELMEKGRAPHTVRGNWPYFDPGSVLPAIYVNRAAEHLDSNGSGEKPRPTNPAVVDALEAILNDREGKKDSVSAIAIIQVINHPRAVALLRLIAYGTFGCDDLRLRAVRALEELGQMKKGEVHKIWLKGEWQGIRSQLVAANPEIASASVPADLMPLYVAGIQAGNKKRFAEAERIWREFIEKAPDFFPAYHNLGAVLLAVGKNADESERLMKKSLDMAPNYLFARSGLATIYIESDRLDEARDILDKADISQAAHPNALASFFVARARLAIAAKEPHFESWLDMAREIDPDNAVVKDMDDRLGDTLPFFKAMRGFIGSLAEMREKRAVRQRDRVLSPDAPLFECYGCYKVCQLNGMAKVIGAPGGQSRRRFETLSVVCSALSSPELVHRLVAGLGENEKGAIKLVLDAGGETDYDLFTLQYGNDIKDPENWEHTEPTTVLGRLKCRGLLVEATVKRRPAVLIPRDLRPSIP